MNVSTDRFHHSMKTVNRELGSNEQKNRQIESLWTNFYRCMKFLNRSYLLKEINSCIPVLLSPFVQDLLSVSPLLIVLFQSRFRTVTFYCRSFILLHCLNHFLSVFLLLFLFCQITFYFKNCLLLWIIYFLNAEIVERYYLSTLWLLPLT